MSLVPVLSALVPVTALIVVGLVLRRLPGFGADDFWAGTERLAYFCLLPILLFISVAEVDVGRVPLLRLAAALVAPTAIVTIAITLARRHIARDLPAFTSVLQGGIRFNTYIGLSLSASLFGAEGTAVAAIVAAILVPTVNIASSLGFEFLRTGPNSLWAGARSIITNPLVLGCTAGGVFNLGGLGLPQLVSSVLDPLAAAALPIGLICVGAGLQSFSASAHARALIASTAIRLIILPGLTLLALIVFDIPFTAAMVAMIFQAIATASSGYVMARQLGGDAKLIAALIAVQTLLMLFTLPAVLLASRWFLSI